MSGLPRPRRDSEHGYRQWPDYQLSGVYCIAPQAIKLSHDKHVPAFHTTQKRPEPWPLTHRNATRDSFLNYPARFNVEASGFNFLGLVLCELSRG
jgi:hypothetical protein